MPPEPQEIVGESCEEKMYLVGHKPYISGPRPIQMKTENAKNFFNLTSYCSKPGVPFSLIRA